MKIRWTKLALADLENARLHIAAENPYAVITVIECIEQALAALASYPEMARSGRLKGTRELVVTGTPFIIPYRVRKNGIELLAVIHHSRAWPEEL